MGFDQKACAFTTGDRPCLIDPDRTITGRWAHAGLSRNVCKKSHPSISASSKSRMMRHGGFSAFALSHESASSPSVANSYLMANFAQGRTYRTSNVIVVVDNQDEAHVGTRTGEERERWCARRTERWGPD